MGGYKKSFSNIVKGVRFRLQNPWQAGGGNDYGNNFDIMHHTDGSYELITSEGDHAILEETTVQGMMEDGFQVIEE